MRTTTTTKRAAIYLRCSTQGQFTDNQRPEVEQFVQARGLDVVAVFEENVSAAARVRPEFEKMLKAAHSGAFGCLIVWSLDRIGRSMVGNLQTVLDLERKGVTVLSVKESFLDAELGPARQLLLGVLGWVAEQERARIGERVRAGLERLKRQNVKLGRKPTAFNLKTARRLQDEGHSIRAIAKQLGVSSSVVHRGLVASRKPDAPEGGQVVESR
jgi:DNA invertase Pin-like site-specific DNA recombinase